MAFPPRWHGLLLIPFFIFVGLSSFIEAQELTDAQIDIVGARLREASQKSWELGTFAQTILERNATTYSVFSSQSLPPPSSVPSSQRDALEPFFDIARAVSSQTKNQTGPQPFMPDVSAADPVSIGVCILIANWTKAGSLGYGAAAKSQIDYLFTAVPKTSDGAISHRVSQVQLWSDSVYMVPPFLAYYGVITRNRTVVGEAYNQVKLYRQYLRDPRQGMWRHVVLGTSGDQPNDPGFWSTGNGWAAAGMLRVYATIKHSEYANTFKHELQDIANWVQEIHAGIYPHLDNSGLLTNYIDVSTTSSGNFYDAASTAFLASTVYRAAKLLDQKTYIPYAERSRKALSAPASSPPSPSNSTGFVLFPAQAHFTTDGILTPVVDPFAVGAKATTVSAEAQAFVVQMHVAWKDWKDGKSPKASVAKGESVGMGKVFMLLATLAGTIWMVL